MAIWKITRREPGSSDPYVETGEVYDDATVPIADYVGAIRTRDGWDYNAEQVPAE